MPIPIERCNFADQFRFMHAKPPPPPVHNDKDALHDMSSQIKAFVIFLVAFIALFLYSKSSVGVTFAHQLLKKIDLDKYLVSTSDTDTVSLAMVEEKLEPDSTPQRFLFVGDSMVEPMAYRFFDICRRDMVWQHDVGMEWPDTRLLHRGDQPHLRDFLHGQQRTVVEEPKCYQREPEEDEGQSGRPSLHFHRSPQHEA